MFLGEILKAINMFDYKWLIGSYDYVHENLEYIAEAQVGQAQAQAQAGTLDMANIPQVQSNFNSSNTDGSFTMANSNSFWSPFEIFRQIKKTNI